MIVLRLAGNSKFLKKLNRLQVFDCIRNSGTISKAEIKNITKLTPTAISEITGEMIKENLILETGVGESTGGRPSQLLSLNPAFAYFIGIDIDINYIKASVVNFGMEVVCSVHKYIDDFNPQKVNELLIECISFLIYESGISKDSIKSVGIGVPAIIGKEGIIEFAPNLKWVQVDLRSSISNTFGIPVIVDNESKLSAYAERHIGRGRGVDNFMCVNIRSGIGSGIYIKGRLYRGVSGNAGELGHITVKENGTLCGCGNYGCLETLSSSPSVIKRALACKKQGEGSLLFQRVSKDEDITLKDIADASYDGDELCTRLLKSASKYLGIGISSVINLINPGLIILGGDLIHYSDIVLPKVREIVEKKSLAGSRIPCTIEVTSLQNSTILGASIACINRQLGYTEDLESYMLEL